MRVHPMTQKPKKFMTIILSTHPHFAADYVYAGYLGSVGFHICNYPEYKIKQWEEIASDFIGYVYLGGDEYV